MSEQVISTINDFIASQEIDKNQPKIMKSYPICSLGALRWAKNH